MVIMDFFLYFIRFWILCQAIYDLAEEFRLNDLKIQVKVDQTFI